MALYKVGDYVVCLGGLCDPVEGAWFVKNMTYGKILEVDDSTCLTSYTVDFGQEEQYKCIVNQVSEESLAPSRQSEFDRFIKRLNDSHTTFEELASMYFELKHQTDLDDE
jgi:hypothetical protein